MSARSRAHELSNLCASSGAPADSFTENGNTPSKRSRRDSPLPRGPSIFAQPAHSRVVKTLAIRLISRHRGGLKSAAPPQEVPSLPFRDWRYSLVYQRRDL